MVHRAPDSRLLSNLVGHEKDYQRQLAALFPASHQALASLSAYAATNPAGPARSIAAVVDVLARADDALQRYAHAVDLWRDQLVALKDLEDDLAGVLRDRDILVTRLIKASKATRDHRSSRLIANLGSASLSSIPSTASTASSVAGSPANTNVKLAQARAELQACEAHLVAKEAELDARRISLARDGLGARCRALIDCGWLWGEMGKQGLKALQAHASPIPSKALPTPNLGPNPMNTSDTSSLTPSQSASQTAALSASTNHEDVRSTDYAELQIKSTQTLTVLDEADVTITLPPAHAISELTLPTADSLTQKVQPADQDEKPLPAPVPRRKSTQRRRPPSQHITEASDEGSDGPSSASHPPPNTVPLNTNSHLPRPFPTVRTLPSSEETFSSEEPHPIGPFEIVDNDPFQVMHRSMRLSPSASALFVPPTGMSNPSARASAPDVRTGLVRAATPPPVPPLPALPLSTTGPTPSPGPRERRPSLAFFGSLRGLFRKPKERRAVTEWEPSPDKPNGRSGGGWVTRTDARINGQRKSGEDTEDEPTPSTTRTRTTMDMPRRTPSRLRKGRPVGRHGNGSAVSVPGVRTGASVDGWLADDAVGANQSRGGNINTPGQAGLGLGPAPGGRGQGLGKSRTRRGTSGRRKTSVADLRGSDQGHTDGEVGGPRSLERVPSESKIKSKGRGEDVGDGPGRVLEASLPPPTPADGSKHLVEVERERERTLRLLTSKDLSTESGPTGDNVESNINKGASTDTNANLSGVEAQPRRSTSMTRKTPPDATTRHRRSASVDAHVIASVAQASPSPVSSGSPGWGTPPTEIQSGRTSPSPSPAPRTRTPSPSSRQNARRSVGNGHGKHKHDQNQSLMSIVADVTRERDVERERKAASIEVPRAPGSVLAAETNRDSRGHARSASSPTGMPVNGEQRQVQAQTPTPTMSRPVKMPLKSVLRNASRTPSPSPASMITPAPVSRPREVQQEVAQAEERDRGRAISPTSLRDSASISSYETGRESLDGEMSSPVRSRSPQLRSRSASPVRSTPGPAPPRTHTPPLPPLSFTFPPPPAVSPPGTVRANGHGRGNSNVAGSGSVPSSSTSTETAQGQGQGQGRVKRKSVRVSLHPTFSPTPPALYDEEGEGYAPWSASFSARGREERVEDKKALKTPRGKHVRHPEDVWADSSEEDEAYAHARRLLSAVGSGKQDKGKGKGKARART